MSRQHGAVVGWVSFGMAVWLSAGTVSGQDVVKVSRQEARWWIQHVIPLPKQITIRKAVRVAASNVVVVLAPDAPELVRGAATRVAARFGGVPQTHPAGPGQFEIYLAVGQLLAPGAVPNAEQAYVMGPWGGHGLLLCGLGERGAFYAAMTLLQLLDATAPCETGEAITPPGGPGQRSLPTAKAAADRRVTIPIPDVLDWPDLAERGQWDGSMANDMERMAALKLNLYEAHARLSVTPEGRGKATAVREFIERGRSNAFTIVQIIHHLDQNSGAGLYTHCPETRGRDAAGKPSLRTPCCAQPRMRQILTDWLCDLAGQPEVNAINIWLTEDVQGTGVCHCDACAQAGQYAMEIDAAVQAWRTARERNTNLTLRILLTQGTEWVGNDKIVPLIPPEVGVSYYSGGGSYNVSRDPMIPPLLEQRAAAGGWVGVYPTLEPQYDSTCPWSCPQFVKFRMTELVDKQLQNMCAFVQPNNRAYDLNVTASAEWSWNAHGRSPREFALAWATRRGFRNPEAAADWAVTLGPVGWDVYGYGIWFKGWFDEAVTLLRTQRTPRLGTGEVNKGIFRYFPSAAAFRRDLMLCRKAMALAERSGAAELVEETRVTAGFVIMLQAVYNMAVILAADRAPTDKQRLALRDALQVFAEAAADTVAAQRAWLKSCGIEGGVGYTDLADTIENAGRQMSEVLEPWGIRSPYLAYLPREIGKWEDADFREQAAIRKSYDVTRLLSGPGRYAIKFVYRGGSVGLGVSRVALTAAVAGQPPQEVAADAHEGWAAIWSKGHVYEVELSAWDSNATYRIEADIRGACRRAGEEWPATVGEVLLRKVLASGTRLPPLPLVPMKPEVLENYRGPEFRGRGIRVGVIRGGFGSAAVLKYLQELAGMDAQPLNGKAGLFAACQVVVYPQPRRNADLTPSALADLREFVKKGGGLIALHDAPGYRECPVVIPEVCARGTLNVIEEHWRTEGEHPVTAGLARDTPLTKSYYDFITLEPGPRGEVVARGFDGRQPVVIAGRYGKGRYVACGLCIGIGPGTALAETAPTPDEARLLENAVRWVAGE